MMTDSDPPTVTIIGAGMAGLTAALALAERGYKVTIYDKGTEQDAGGNLGVAFQTFDETTVCFEVFPHMFGDWYFNFFDLAEKLRLHKRRDFRPCPKLGYVIRDHGINFATVVDNGSPQTFLNNIRSGAGNPLDLFLAGYAVLDILSQDFMEAGLQSEQTLNGFLASRPYATRGMLQVFQNELLYIWAINSYITSVQAYTNYAKFQIGSPAPSSWALNGNSYEKIVRPLLNLLQNRSPACTSVDINFDTKVCGITAKDHKVLEICVEPRIHDDDRQKPKRHKVAVDNLILAVPPSALGPLVAVSADEAMHPELFMPEGNAVIHYIPNLTRTRLLDSGNLAVLYVPLRQTFNFIHQYYVGAVDSAAMLSFIEVPYLGEQFGPGVKTALAIGISNVSAIPAWEGNGPVDGPARPPPPPTPHHHEPEHVDLNWTIANQVLQEFIEYVPREQRETFRKSVIQDRMYLKANNTAKIYLNQVGNGLNEPPTVCPRLPNLFFATGANDNPIEIATVECAVVGGLLAARALWQQNPASAENVINSINPRLPPRYDWATLLVSRAALTPWALAAKCMADGQEISQKISKEIGPNPLEPWLVFSLEMAEALWLSSLVPGTAALRSWVEIFPPQTESPLEAAIAPQVIGDISDLVNSALQATTIPAWLGIQSARLGADIVAGTIAAMWATLARGLDQRPG